MHTNQFEQAFGDFLSRPEYDEAENALFEIVRAAFEAGWNAAKGAPLPERKIVHLLNRAEREKT